MVRPVRSKRIYVTRTDTGLDESMQGRVVLVTAVLRSGLTRCRTLLVDGRWSKRADLIAPHHLRALAPHTLKTGVSLTGVFVRDRVAE
jgi:hypothetical protein